MTDFSCADYTFPLLTRSQTLSLLGLLDFRYIDLGLFQRNEHLQTSAMIAAPAQFASDLVEDLKRSNLQASDLFLQIGDDPRHASTNDPDDNIRFQNREIFKYSLELCSKLQCAHMTGLPGVHHGHPSRDFARAVDEAQWRVDTCSGSGITYAIEPHIGSICADIESTFKLLDAVSDLTLTLDYGHFIAAGHSSEAVHALLPDSSHMHLRGGAPGRLQTAVQENTIDFNGALNRLRQLDYTGVLALEYVWIDWEGCNRSDTLSETLLLRQLISTITNSLQWKAGWNV